MCIAFNNIEIFLRHVKCEQTAKKVKTCARLQTRLNIGFIGLNIVLSYWVHTVHLLCHVSALNNETVTPGREQIFSDISLNTPLWNLRDSLCAVCVHNRK